MTTKRLAITQWHHNPDRGAAWAAMHEPIGTSLTEPEDDMSPQKLQEHCRRVAAIAGNATYVGASTGSPEYMEPFVTVYGPFDKPRHFKGPSWAAMFEEAAEYAREIAARRKQAALPLAAE